MSSNLGGGQSTLWWVDRAQSVTCMESNAQWCQMLSRKVAGRAQINHVSSPERAAQILGDRLFDVIVVDDGSGVGPHGRVANAQAADLGGDCCSEHPGPGCGDSSCTTCVCDPAAAAILLLGGRSTPIAHCSYTLNELIESRRH